MDSRRGLDSAPSAARRHPRADLCLPIEVEVRGRACFVGECIDLSATGMRARLLAPVHPGAEVLVRWSLAGRALQRSATVARAGDHDEIGLEFADTDDGTLDAALAEFRSQRSWNPTRRR